MSSPRVTVEVIGSSEVFYHSNYHHILQAISQKYSEALIAAHVRAQKFAGLLTEEQGGSALTRQIIADIEANPEAFITPIPNPATDTLPVDVLESALKKAVFRLANQELFHQIAEHSSKSTIQYFANGSECQNYQENELAKLKNTTCLFHDLIDLAAVVEKQAVPSGTFVRLNALTLPDIVNQLPHGENYRRIVSKLTHGHDMSPKDTSLHAHIYMLAHDHAKRHKNAEIIMHYYLSDINAVRRLERQLTLYPYMLPSNLTIVLHHFRGNLGLQIAIKGRGIIDDNYPYNIRRLFSAAKKHARTLKWPLDDIASSLDIPALLNSRGEVEDEIPKKSLSALIDGDGCFYGFSYTIILCMVILKYHVKLAEVTDKTRHEFVNEVREYIKNIDTANFDMIMFERLVAEVNMRLGHIKVMRLAQIFLRKETRLNGRHLLAHFAYELDALNVYIMLDILYRANIHLFSDMIVRADRSGCDNIIFFCGSNRQSSYADVKNSIANGTGLFMRDLSNMVNYLNMRFPNLHFSFKRDTLLLTDLYHPFVPGEVMRQLGVGRNHFPSLQYHAVFDIEKFGLIYAFLHYIRHYYPDITHLVFYDDRLDILNSLAKIFGANDQHGLLPKDMKLSLVRYFGSAKERQEVFNIVGSGKTDRFLHSTMRFFAKLCKVDINKIDEDPPVINMASELNFKHLARMRARSLPNELSHFDRLTTEDGGRPAVNHQVMLFSHAQEHDHESPKEKVFKY